MLCEVFSFLFVYEVLFLKELYWKLGMWFKLKKNLKILIYVFICCLILILFI